jgi:hypothetical protein
MVTEESSFGDLPSPRVNVSVPMSTVVHGGPFVVTDVPHRDDPIVVPLVPLPYREDSRCSEFRDRVEPPISFPVNFSRQEVVASHEQQSRVDASLPRAAVHLDTVSSFGDLPPPIANLSAMTVGTAGTTLGSWNISLLQNQIDRFLPYPQNTYETQRLD